MPIFTVLDESKIDKNDVLNEGIFDGPAPNDFKKFALEFFKKVNKHKPLRGSRDKTYEDIIKSDSKWKYSFEIDDPRNSMGKALMTAGVRGAASGAVGGTVGGNNQTLSTAVGVGTYTTLSNLSKTINEKKEREELIKIISSCGFKDKVKTGWYKDNFYKVSLDKKYVYMAWEAVAVEGSYFSTYAICLQCFKYDKVSKKMHLDESGTFVSGVNRTNKMEKEMKDKLGSLFDPIDDSDLVKDSIGNEIRRYVPYPQLERAFVEAFDYNDNHTRKTLMSMNEVEHNKVLTDLTSKLYDQVVSKAHNIDYGEIPKTKGDITKLSNFEEMLDTLRIIKGIIKEYKQDSKPVDDISVAISHIQSRKDLFERAFRYDCELPMLMYDNMVMAVVTGTTYMITSCIEFIKAPKDESFSIQLNKVAYNKSKDNLIYNSISKFNKSCESGDFDKAMQMIIDKKIKKFSGVTIAAGIAAGVILLVNIVPLMRELTFMFYYNKTKVSDFFAVQADLLTMNAYNVQHNETLDPAERDEIYEKQMAIATKFRNISNKFNIEEKRAEVSATKDIENTGKKYKLDDDANIVADEDDNNSEASVLF